MKPNELDLDWAKQQLVDIRDSLGVPPHADWCEEVQAVVAAAKNREREIRPMTDIEACVRCAELESEKQLLLTWAAAMYRLLKEHVPEGRVTAQMQHMSSVSSATSTNLLKVAECGGRAGEAR